MLAVPELDAVCICTPSGLHAPLAIAAANAGKHALVEKPMALTLEECEKMMQAEKDTGLKLMVGQVSRYAPAFAKAKDIIDSGRIGELYFVESEYAHDYSVARGANDWRVTPERHAVIGGGCHAIDLLRWIAGDPTEVYAYANHKCLTDWPVNDCTIAIYQFPNNVSGKVFVSIGCKRNYTMRSAFYGTKGTIICDNTSPTITLFECGEPTPDGHAAYTQPVELPVEINNHNITAEIDVFVSALLSGSPMPVSSLEGASTVAVCRATVDAVEKKQPVIIHYPSV